MTPVTHELIEWQDSKPIALSEEQVRELRKQGEWFASRISDKESESSDPLIEQEVESDQKQATVIRCTYVAEGSYTVRVENHIGAIRVDDQTFIIKPKIAFKHFAYISRSSNSAPLSRKEQIQLDSFTSFHELIARWFLDEALSLVPQRLIRDYRPHFENTPQVRGRVNVLSSSRRWLTGNLSVDCDYEEFDLDHPINRLIKEALNRLQYADFLGLEMRSEARRLFRAMGEVGPLQAGDRNHRPDRRAKDYLTGLELARNILAGQGRATSEGNSYSRAFLVHTPPVIEAGIRAILQQDLKPYAISLSKVSRPTPPLRSADPDLVFNDGTIVGDVKYKVTDSWSDIRPDIYQSIFFAAAFKTFKSIIVAFTQSEILPLEEVAIGDHRLNGFLWNGSDTVDPDGQRNLLRKFVLALFGEEPISKVA
jgi:5-methylcytosine-specific restriction endonuclease McrBC regulatory subunit McrC